MCYSVQVCTRVTEELHSFLSESELSKFFMYIITMIICSNNIVLNIMVMHDAIIHTDVATHDYNLFKLNVMNITKEAKMNYM